ncbi:MAG TPA: thiamine pyrophosphate-dependent enzyme [Methylomirabilota bacterium]|jgi:2-oxoglutarate ferredoxin oxidoreductase subunit beta|nr:thiamine pyrophosphate-dependent enzyme [Methylomirabilota bacterium]
MPELAFAELGFKERLKVDLFPTIWCPGCGIGTIMIQLAMVLDEMGMDETNTIIVTGIGCTGRMGSYLKHESVYTLHGRTLPVAEAIKAVRPEMHVVVVAGDGDTASIGGNHLIHAIRRNAPLTVLCNNNEIYGLTGGQTGPTTPTGTKTLSSPAGNPNTPINLQGLVRSSQHALYAKTTVYHQLHMRNAIKEAIEHDGFSFVDITSQCIENNGRRIGFASANDMLNFYRKTYKRAARDADHLNPFEIGILSPRVGEPINGNGAGVTSTPERPPELPAQPTGPMISATESPGAAAPPATDDEKARRRAESQQRAAVMAQLSTEVKLAVAKKELTLTEALQQAGIPIPEWLRTGASAPSGAPVAPGEVTISATGKDPRTQDQPTQLDAQKAEAKVEERNLIGGTPGGETQPAAPQTAHDAAPPAVPLDPKEAKRAEAQRKLALMQRLPSEVKLRVAKGEITLADALREAGIDPDAAA